MCTRRVRQLVLVCKVRRVHPPYIRSVDRRSRQTTTPSDAYRSLENTFAASLSVIYMSCERTKGAVTRDDPFAQTAD
ncbi:hypothetical protein EVAR_14910_1 [Eumeta japonica]|uniref:Uncharacterized protein n=1 Tax=Eumeta variegata TaxID=151549 RepID=A0A4C1XMX1_EUMVA|nr:hypothetical protein EVAR_14910_1 [Eumeta japonica]